MSDCTSGMRVQREGEGGVGGAVRGWSGHWSGTVGERDGLRGAGVSRLEGRRVRGGGGCVFIPSACLPFLRMS